MVIRNLFYAVAVLLVLAPTLLLAGENPAEPRSAEIGKIVDELSGPMLPVTVAPEYALAMAGSIDGKCKVIIWIHDVAGSRKIEYAGENYGAYNSCGVYVPRPVFEKDFKYCLLSGITIDTSGEHHATFGGGPAGGRDEYWFEWTENAHPTFYCFLK